MQNLVLGDYNFKKFPSFQFLFLVLVSVCVSNSVGAKFQQLEAEETLDPLRELGKTT